MGNRFSKPEPEPKREGSVISIDETEPWPIISKDEIEIIFGSESISIDEPIPLSVSLPVDESEIEIIFGS